jgi:hypothetical protein
MSYGLQFINSSNVVTLDSEFARLTVLSSGRYAPTQESGIGSVTSFPQTITSQEPPLVFVRPDTVAGGIAGLCLMRVVGSPGAWTGFYVRGYNNDTLQPNGRWFAAAFMSKPTASFGMRMWDGAGSIIFDSGNPAAVFTRSFQNWAYVRTVVQAPTYFNYYKVDFNFPENEFVLINNFGMNLVAGNGPGRQLYMLWNFADSTLYAVTASTSNPNAFYLPAIFAKMAV